MKIEQMNGRALGGAPSATGEAPVLPKMRTRAFTLVEIMVVVVILGILAATIIPQFISSKQDAMINAAKADIANLENAIDRFYINMDRLPTTEEGLKVLAPDRIIPPCGIVAAPLSRPNMVVPDVK